MPAESVFEHVASRSDSAHAFAKESGLDFVYEVRASGIDMNARFGDMSPFPWGREVAVPGPISPRAITRVHPVR